MSGFSNTGGSAKFVITSHGKYLYKLNKDDTLSSYAVQSDGSLQQVGSNVSAGSQASELAVDPLSRFVFSGSLTGVTSYVIQSNGALAPVPNPPPVQGPPGFYMRVDPTGQFLYQQLFWTSSGSNGGPNYASLVTWKIDPNSGALTLQGAIQSMPRNGGDFVLSADGSLLFMVSDYAGPAPLPKNPQGTLWVYPRNTTTGVVGSTPLASVNTMTPNPASIAFSPDGSTLYVGEAMNNIYPQSPRQSYISVFSYNAGSNVLAQVGKSYPTATDPAELVAGHNGNYLYAAGCSYDWVGGNGCQSMVWSYSLSGGGRTLTQNGSLLAAGGQYPSGLALKRSGYLYVDNWVGGITAFTTPSQPPVVTGFPAGSVQGPGSLLTISGTGFDAVASANQVVFGGGANATALSATPTSLTVLVPGNALSGPVTVVSNGLSSAPSATSLTIVAVTATRTDLGSSGLSLTSSVAGSAGISATGFELSIGAKTFMVDARFYGEMFSANVTSLPGANGQTVGVRAYVTVNGGVMVWGPSTQVAVPPLSGSVMGGASPVTGSTVIVYAAGTTAAPQPLEVTTLNVDAQGHFLLNTPLPASASGKLLYAVSYGGNAGGGVNASTALVTLIGVQGSAEFPPYLTINELTTAATAYQFQGVLQETDCRNILQSTRSGTCLQLASNAFLNDNATAWRVLIDPVTGDYPLTANYFLSRQKPYFGSLASILAACVESPTNSQACNSLQQFTGAQTTAGMAAYIYANPVRNAAAIYALQPKEPAFFPYLYSAPASWAPYGVLGIPSAQKGSCGMQVTAASTLALPAGIVSFVYQPNNLGGEASAPATVSGSSYSAFLPLSALRAGSSTTLRLRIQASASSDVTYSTPYTFVAPVPQSGVNCTATLKPVISNVKGVVGIVSYREYVYVSNVFDHTISMLTPPPANAPAGTLWTSTVIAGQAGKSGFQDGPGTSALFNSPNGLAVDAVGNLYVADMNNNRIRKLSSANGQWNVSTLAGSGVPVEPMGGKGTVFVYQDGAPGVAQFNLPQGVAVDAKGNVYVADTGASVIRMVLPTGYVSTIAGAVEKRYAVSYTGNASWPGKTDGRGFQAAFDAPVGISIDGNGNLYVMDSGNARVRKMLPVYNGLSDVSTIPLDSRGSLRYPDALALDPSANIYVANSDFTLRNAQGQVLAGIAGTNGLSLQPPVTFPLIRGLNVRAGQLFITTYDAVVALPLPVYPPVP